MKQTVTNLLLWSQQYTKTDMLYLAKGSFWLNTSQIISMCISLFLSIIFARYLSQETLGTYKYTLSLIGLIGSISLSGIGTAISRAVAKGAEGEFIKGFFITLRWSLLVALASLIVAVYYFLNDNILLATCMLIGGAFSPLLDSGELYSTLLSGRKLFKELSIYRIYRSIFIFLGLGIIALITDSVIVLVFVYFLTQSLSALILFYVVYRSRRPNTILDPDARSIGTHVSIMNFIGILADRVDDVLVFHFLGPVKLAIYSYSVAIPENLAGFVKQIGGLAVPKYVQQDLRLAQSTMFRKIVVATLVMLPITVLYIFLSPLVFDFLFPQYQESIPYTQLYAFILLIHSTLPAALLDAHKAIRQKYIITITNSIVKISLLVLGTWWLGLLGVVLAKIIGKLVSALILFFIARNLRHIS